MTYAIGIYGSAGTETEAAELLAASVGRAIADAGCSAVTGACSGLPYIAAAAAAHRGAAVEGFSPVSNAEEQRQFTPGDDLGIYSRLHFLPSLFADADLVVAKKYRNVASTAHCHAGVVIAGGWGTLHEICSLVAFGKPVGVLEGSGGVADNLRRLAADIGGVDERNMIFDSNPNALVRRVVDRLSEA